MSAAQGTYCWIIAEVPEGDPRVSWEWAVGDSR